jgi:hypothetical protein
MSPIPSERSFNSIYTGEEAGLDEDLEAVAGPENAPTAVMKGKEFVSQKSLHFHG